ncbi:alpha/beta fold hydrolase [Streptomyces sp. B1866]|uniref:alpha/beta hydrolase n=1 Tax=Streptomyces sp. B1866 TaxID=3075431 RepID=UPI00288E78BF|nr:alpha/beta fold hydrolase [Streptomyces sp. B1866]MDT3399939.1 alpha/beta fold hydrolase [Streptomyces sp. B1866]
MSTDRTARPEAAGGKPGPLSWVASALALPLAPLYGALLAYFVYHPPRRPYHKKPEDLGLAATELTVPLDGRGRRLHLWLCPGARDRVVVVGHGLGLSKAASLAHAKLLSDAGYTVALFDHRNHGRSSADRACWGMSDRHTGDVLAVVRHLRAQEEYASARIAVYGFSISTFPSLYMLRKADECPVDAVVFDSGPSLELGSLFGNFVAAGGLPVPRFLRTGPSGRVLAKACGALATAMLRVEWPPPVQGAYARTPMLVLTGERDTMIPEAGVRALAERYPLAEVHALPDTEHLQGIKAHPDIYTDIVLGFLDRSLKE